MAEAVGGDAEGAPCGVEVSSSMSSPAKEKENDMIRFRDRRYDRELTQIR